MNEELTITKEQARLSVVGNCYPDSLTNSGAGPDLTMDLIDLLDDLGIDLPDIDPGDWDDIDAIIGYDDEGNPILVYPDPDTGEIIEWPIDFPIDPLDWPDIDVTPGLDDDGLPVIEFPDPDTGEIIAWPVVLPEGFDPEDWPDTDITAELDDDGNPIISFDDIDLEVGDLDIDDLSDRYDLDWMLDLDITGLDNIAGIDTDFKVHVENLPESIVIVTEPNKLRYVEGSSIDLTGMVVTAKKSDGTTWTSAKYPNGHIPLGELITEPLVATEEGRMAYNFDYGFFCHLSTNFYDRTFTKTSWGKAYGGLIISPDGWHNPVIVSDDEAAVRWHCEDVRSPIFTRDFGVSGSTVVHGLRVYYGTGYGLREGSSGTGLQASGIDTFYGVLSGLLESIVAGDGMCKVVIRWARPGDSKELWTSFDVEVIPKGHGGGR